MNVSPKIRIIELRNYLITPRTRDRFIDYFENHFLNSQNILGGYVLGQFRTKEEEDNFLWIRGYEDMRSRPAFLRGFYDEGEVWQEFGSGANEMLLDSDNVYLLKSLNDESFNLNNLANGSGIIVIDFYTTIDHQLDKFTDFFQADYVPAFKNKPTLWVSEMTANDFPKLRVIQG